MVSSKVLFYSHHRMKRFFASITLTLFDSDCLSWRFHFDAIEMKLKTVNFFKTLTGPDKDSFPLKLSMTGNLKDYKERL